ncbi:MAG TPA: HemK/PrmC family methyltransferase [Acidimicrobiales bacterium]|jgi:release factor glutamine methyltransferase
MPTTSPAARRAAARELEEAGFVDVGEDVAELADAARGDDTILAALVARRKTGEPLAWITGTTRFCGRSIAVCPGVYVPRPQSEPLAKRAAHLLADHCLAHRGGAVGLAHRGRAVDLGTGSGALARVLLDRCPGASVIGTERDPLAAACARRNGVRVAEGDLFDGVPAAWRATVDVVVGVLPYVPTRELAFLPHDVRAFEPEGALDGGPDGLAILRRAVVQSASWLRPGGHLLVEIGGDQPDAVPELLEESGFGALDILYDADGDARGLQAVAAVAGR